MKAKIDDQLICIPPYISSTWEQVRFLQSHQDPDSPFMTLSIHLQDGKEVQIPHLDSSLIDIAFSAHMKHLEKKLQPVQNQPTMDGFGKTFGTLLQQMTGMTPAQLVNIPIRFGITGLEGIPGVEITQHTLSQANAPDMPQEILDRIAEMFKNMSQGDVAAFPKPEPHCNCPHCQVARSVHGIEKPVQEAANEEQVSDEELNFRDWDITKKSEQLYLVSNPLNPNEQYSVFLGTPVGCTCGSKHCEHIKAVLYS